MSALRLLLLPFALLFDLVTRIRNRMYDTQWKPSVEFELPVVGVGNLALGGTGKTPMIEYLIRMLTPHLKVATVSRGYGRKTKGFRIINSTDNAFTVGDEPFQLYSKYNDRVVVSVGEERALAIPQLLTEHSDTQVILLDDAFQHRRVKPGFSILLTEYDSPFYSDYVLPAGRLREHPRGADRADAIVVTKCPKLVKEDLMIEILSKIHKYTKKPVFFSTIRYGTPIPMLGQKLTEHKQVILVSGIANHAPLEEYVKANFTLMKHFVFRDHHNYSLDDIKSIKKFVEGKKGQVTILTTEKDRVKLEGETLKEVVSTLPFFYLPIEMKFIRNGKDFDALVLQLIKRD
ncbi:MAG: tetraacyldisaccharide 4'-kinase [Cyclobacteriaceae bacterium]|nr:tetraacyldisaccharide 4'-kinase [Cyclobacteriaceae bacterium]